MARPLKPFIRCGGYYPSRKWTPLVYNGGYTTMNGGEEPEPPTPVYWKTITGASPLALAKALAHSIKSLTQYGLCTQSTTPTPSAPVDIVCNNGALTMVDDELPAAYKRVLGFSMNNDTYWEITGFKLRGSDTIRFSFSASTACNVLGCYNGTSATNNYSLYTATTSGWYLRYGNATYNSVIVVDKRYDVVLTPTGSHGMENDSTWTAKTFTSTNDMCIGTTSTTATSSKMVGSLFGDVIVDGRLHLVPCERVSDNALGYYDLIGETFYEQDETYNGAVSLGYDGSHYVLRTVGTPEVLTVSGAYDSRLPSGYTPCEYISASGTDEYINTGIVINAIGTDVEVDFQYIGTTTGTPRMLWGYMGNPSNLPRWGFGVYSSKWLGSPNATASVGTADNTTRHKAVMRVLKNSGNVEVYNGDIDGEKLYSANNLANVALFTGNTLPLILFGRNNNGTAGSFAEAKIYGFKVTVNGVVTHELIPCLNADSEAGVYDLNTNEFHGNEGETALGYAVKYSTLGTASAENLLAVGDYADTQEIIGGTVKRNCGVWVLTGEENWSTASTNTDVYYVNQTYLPDDYAATNRFTPICSHLEGIISTQSITAMTANTIKTNNSSKIVYVCVGQTYTAAEWKAFLAAQYAAGTPVIVVYPLAEETTDSVTPQTISTSEGDNVMIVTSNVDPVTLEVEYASSEEE